MANQYTVLCECGKRMRVEEKHIGLTGNCVECGKAILINLETVTPIVESPRGEESEQSAGVLGVVFVPDKFRDIPYGWEAIQVVLATLKPGSVGKISMYHGDVGFGPAQRFYLVLDFQDENDSRDCIAGLNSSKENILEYPEKRLLIRSGDVDDLNIRQNLNPLVTLEGNTARDETNKHSFLAHSRDDVQKMFSDLGWVFVG